MNSLHETRLKHGLSLRLMAELTKVTPKTFSQVERGLSIPWLRNKKAIEKILGKINWLDVPYIETKPIKSDVDHCEREFRILYRKIISLPEDEKEAFIKSARKHLSKLITK